MALFDRLVIAVAVNKDKHPLFSLEERTQMVNDLCQSLQSSSDCELVVAPFENLLVQCARDHNANTLVRGLRAVSDFEFEYQMVGMNRSLDPKIETVFLMSDAQYQPIASRLVKEVARLGGDISNFVSPAVAEALKQKFRG